MMGAMTKTATKTKPPTPPVPPTKTVVDTGDEDGHDVYVVAPKRHLVHEGKTLVAGEVVPGAHLWPRVEAWVRAGRIVKQK